MTCLLPRKNFKLPWKPMNRSVKGISDVRHYSKRKPAELISFVAFISKSDKQFSSEVVVTLK